MNDWDAMVNCSLLGQLSSQTCCSAYETTVLTRILVPFSLYCFFVWTVISAIPVSCLRLIVLPLAQNFVPVHGKDPMYHQPQRVPMRAGSLLVWDQRVAHGSRPNNSTQARWVSVEVAVSSCSWVLLWCQHGLVSCSLANRAAKPSKLIWWLQQSLTPQMSWGASLDVYAVQQVPATPRKRPVVPVRLTYYAM